MARNYLRRMSEREIRNLNPTIIMRDRQLSRKHFVITHATTVTAGKTYKPNGAREVARRLRQAEARA